MYMRSGQMNSIGMYIHRVWAATDIQTVIILSHLCLLYTSSMETTLSDGDNLIVDKISYRFREPERFEIVVFPYQYEENTYYIKRIIGLPGETCLLYTSFQLQ